MREEPLNFFITSSDEAYLEVIENSLVNTFPSCVITTAKNCDEALGYFRSGKKFDGYIFDEEKCYHFDLLLDKVIDSDKPFISTSELKMDLVRIESNQKGISYVSIRRDLFNFAHNDYPFKEILKFIFLPPILYFSYGNQKENEVINLSREILLEVESCIKSVFPNIKTKKDFTDFAKGGIHYYKREDLVSAPHIIIILSKEYFYSYHCMEELYLILRSVDFNLEGFNKKICLIFSKNLQNLLDTGRIEHSDFMSNLEKYWIEQLEIFVDLYKSRISNETYKEQVKTALNILTHCIKFIDDEIHKILRGNDSTISLENIRKNGYPDLIAEINSKLEENFQTPYKHLSPADKNIIFSARANKYKQYEETFKRYDSENHQASI